MTKTLKECITNQEKVAWFEMAYRHSTSATNKANYLYWINVIGKRIEKERIVIDNCGCDNDMW